MKKLAACLFLLVLYRHDPVTAQPIDKKATRETKHLYAGLKGMLSKGILFGHQDDLAYGVNWKYQPGRSDVKEVSAQYPAMYGWELGGLETDMPANLDTVPFKKIKQYIHDAYQRGGVSTISWHLNNPLTGKSAWDPAPAGSVASALPGGEKNKLYTAWLDKIAGFMLSLKTNDGKYIPVIFRPFHELNGSWFWWGGKNCTPGEIKELWRFTVGYLRDKKNVHNLLYAFNTDRFSGTEEYQERYPGDEWVDIIGFDIYQKGDILANDKFIAVLDKSLTTLETIATEKNKIPALTEFGYNKVPDSSWWTNVFYRAIEKHHIAYVLAWRNAGAKPRGEVEYYVPFKGQESELDFKKFSVLNKIFLQRKCRQQHLYRQ